LIIRIELSLHGRRRVRRPPGLLLLIALLCLQPPALRAESLEAALAGSGYSAAQQETLRDLFSRAQQAGIAPELILPRLEEGLAKKAAAAVLAAALEAEIARLEEARRLILDSAACRDLLFNNAAWLRTANLLAWGAGGREIRRLLEACAGRCSDFPSLSILYVSLVQWGLAADTALTLTEAAAASRLPAADFPGVSELLIRGRRLRLPPEELARRLAEELPRVKNLEELQERLLYD
jgi:hypothetical protein